MVSSVGKPFNLVMGFADPTLTLPQLSEAGVKRISVGGAMARAAWGGFLRAAREIAEKGSFGEFKHAVPYAEINVMFGGETF